MLENATPAADGAGDGGPTDELDTRITRPRDGAVVLAVSGEIDTLTAPVLNVALTGLAGEPDPVLVVNLSEVSFLASSGLAVLVEGARLAEGSGRRLRLVADGRPVVRPLKLTGTDQLFDLHDTLESALAP